MGGLAPGRARLQRAAIRAGTGRLSGRTGTLGGEQAEESETQAGPPWAPRPVPGNRDCRARSFPRGLCDGSLAPDPFPFGTWGPCCGTHPQP